MTGLVTMLVVILAGFLLQQVGRWWDSLADVEPTVTLPDAPRSSATIPPGAPRTIYAVPHEGAWIVTARVTYPDGETILFSSEGSGLRVVPPDYELMGGEILNLAEDYQVIVTYPLLVMDGNATEVRDYPIASLYQAAMDDRYYALYDASQRFIGMVNAASYQQNYAHLPLTYWNVTPPPPTASPEPTTETEN